MDAAGVTALERDVLAVSAAGHTTDEVAEALGPSSESVRGALCSVTNKLGACSKLDVIVIAFRLRLIDLTE